MWFQYKCREPILQYPLLSVSSICKYSFFPIKKHNLHIKCNHVMNRVGLRYIFFVIMSVINQRFC